ncbi:hypothetical protein VNO77_15174 [Canavalia gladiata]|uniref:Aldehyde dehydrogenase domain-containing protein n=1 Tax=Canavalia gladiata TaxID=3824 RepID=A0AAN9LZB3_CANGL
MGLAPGVKPYTLSNLMLIESLLTMLVSLSHLSELGLRIGTVNSSAGLPPGVLNIVFGYGPTTSATLASHMNVDKVFCETKHLKLLLYGMELPKELIMNLV